MTPESKHIEVTSRRYGHYVVSRRLGHGGQAEVFYAEARQGEVRAALKLARPGAPEDALADEADLMWMLSHPNLVSLLEYGVTHGRPFIAMEYLVGGDLSALMAAYRRAMKPFPVALGVHACLEVLKGLAAFHTTKSKAGAELKLVHGDVNPANVYFGEDGAVKLGDFGVASSAHPGVISQPGVVQGKLSYLSPEQTRGEALTAATDVWAVGVMLFETVVGFHPFQAEGASDEQVMASIRSAKLNFPAFLDKPMQAILKGALASDVRNRFKTAGELAGPLFGYALDAGLTMTPTQVRDELQSVLDLVL